MPTYVMLARWTDQGIRAIEDHPRRVDGDLCPTCLHS